MTLETNPRYASKGLAHLATFRSWRDPSDDAVWPLPVAPIHETVSGRVPSASHP